MRRALCAAAPLFLVACGFAPSATIDAPGSGDGRRDGLGPVDGLGCYGSGLATVCLTAVPPPTLAVAVGGLAIVTDNDPSCTQIVTQVSGRSLCVVAATSISIAGPLSATGSRPLVLLATTTLAIVAGGSIDVSSHNGGVIGSGADAAECIAPSNPEGDPGGGGGGAGGSFGGKGGDGGLGDDNNSAGGDGTASPGVASGAQVPTVVRGGCGGGYGGNSNNAQQVGVAGAHSGGAVYLIAGQSITTAGPILASGAGGADTADEQGGPGAGSGGLIGLDAPVITIGAVVIANGGGGGEGGATAGTGGPGTHGQDGTASATVAALGGTGSDQGGDGGNSTAAAVIDANPGLPNHGGGGGGGGGAGYIYVKGTPAGAGGFSPPPSLH